MRTSRVNPLAWKGCGHDTADKLNQPPGDVTFRRHPPTWRLRAFGALDGMPERWAALPSQTACCLSPT